jgi:hypothetical protein
MIIPEVAPKEAVLLDEADWQRGPPPPRSTPNPKPQPVEEVQEEKSPSEKYCRECGGVIRAKALICPKCGVRQASYDDDYIEPSRSGVKIPLLISAIADLVVGLIWIATCFGAFIGVPMILLCVFEFSLYGRADSLPRNVLAGKAKTLAIFQIVVGLFNMITLVCGIISMINAGNLQRAGALEMEEHY